MGYRNNLITHDVTVELDLEEVLNDVPLEDVMDATCASTQDILEYLEEHECADKVCDWVAEEHGDKVLAALDTQALLQELNQRLSPAEWRSKLRTVCGVELPRQQWFGTTEDNRAAQVQALVDARTAVDLASCEQQLIARRHANNHDFAEAARKAATALDDAAATLSDMLCAHQALVNEAVVVCADGCTNTLAIDAMEDAAVRRVFNEGATP